MVFHHRAKHPHVLLGLLPVTGVLLLCLNACQGERTAPLVRVTWVLQTANERALTGFLLPPFDGTTRTTLRPVADGHVYVAHDKPVNLSIVGIGSKHPESTGDAIRLCAVLAPKAVAEGKPGTGGLPQKMRRAAKAVGVDPDLYVQLSWDQGTATGFEPVALRGWDTLLYTKTGQGASFKVQVPAPEGYIVFMSKPDSGAVEITDGSGTVTVDLYTPEKDGDWTFVAIRAQSPAELARTFETSLPKARTIRFLPLNSPGSGRLVSFAVDGRPVPLSVIATAPRAPGLGLQTDSDGLSFEVRERLSWVEIPLPQTP